MVSKDNNKTQQCKKHAYDLTQATHNVTDVIPKGFTFKIPFTHWQFGLFNNLIIEYYCDECFRTQGEEHYYAGVIDGLNRADGF